MTADHRDAAPQKRANSRLFVLDGLRFVAATMVVFYHYVGVPNAKIGHQGATEALAWGQASSNIFPHPLYLAATFGWTGVELFFMISGFVICMSGWGRKPSDFFVSRVVRLVPAYWAATIVTAIVLMALPRLTSGVAPSEVLTNLTMVQSAFGVPNLDPAFWTLLVELMFYLMFGLIAIWGITYRRMIAFCVVWSVAAFIGAASHNEVLNMLFSPPYAPYFVAGIAFYLIYRFGGNLLVWAIVVYSWLIALNVPHTNPPWQVSVTVSSFFVVMALVATHKLDRIRWRWLTLAGALTYPLYLLHQDIGFTVFDYLRGDVPPVLLVILTFAAMLVLAWLIYRAVERPLAPILKTKLTAAVATVRVSGPRGGPATPPAAPSATSPATPATPARQPAHCAAAPGRRGAASRSARLHAARPARPAPEVSRQPAAAPASESASVPASESASVPASGSTSAPDSERDRPRESGPVVAQPARNRS